jgi:hypothetical protein
MPRRGGVKQRELLGRQYLLRSRNRCCRSRNYPIMTHSGGAGECHEPRRLDASNYLIERWPGAFEESAATVFGLISAAAQRFCCCQSAKFDPGYPDIAMAIGDRHRIIVGLVADQRLRTHLSCRLFAGIKGGRQAALTSPANPALSLTNRMAGAEHRAGLVTARICDNVRRNIKGTGYRHNSIGAAREFTGAIINSYWCSA